MILCCLAHLIGQDSDQLRKFLSSTYRRAQNANVEKLGSSCSELPWLRRKFHVMRQTTPQLRFPAHIEISRANGISDLWSGWLIKFPKCSSLNRPSRKFRPVFGDAYSDRTSVSDFNFPWTPALDVPACKLHCDFNKFSLRTWLFPWWHSSCVK